MALGKPLGDGPAMKVAVLGLWHLGTGTAACVADAGVSTVGVDDDKEVVAKLSNGEPPLYEPGLADLVRQGLASGKLSFAADAAKLADADIIWICHDTPVDDDDHANVDSVVRRVEAIFAHLKHGAVVLVSAQLPVGSVARLEKSFAAQASGRQVDFACSPENLRLGRALDVFRNPGRIAIGIRNERTRNRLSPLLSEFCQNLIWMSVESAEMVKHSLNAYLALSITFTNELAAIAEQVGANATDIEKALRSDPRIGPTAYVKAGPAFAGGTLARDVQFLSAIAEREKLETPLIGNIIASNRAHGQWSISQLRRRLGPLKGKTIAVLGLSYKPGTDAIRRSPSIELLRALLADGARARVYDPAVRKLPDEFRSGVVMADDAKSAIAGAAAVVVATEWPQFRELTAEDFFRGMNGRLVLDPAAFLSPGISKEAGLTVVSIGRTA
jgi:UDPglucose 6-dehydrogenase